MRHGRFSVSRGPRKGLQIFRWIQGAEVRDDTRGLRIKIDLLARVSIRSS